jgi:hypothetical protein
MSKEKVDGSVILISVDPILDRNVTIYYQDLRPQTSRYLGNTVFEMLLAEVDCFEMSYEDQNKDHGTYHEIFFNDNELDAIFDHARLAAKVSRSDGHALDPRSGRLVRYSHDEAVRLGIVGGISVIDMD